MGSNTWYSYAIKTKDGDRTRKYKRQTRFSFFVPFLLMCLVSPHHDPFPPPTRTLPLFSPKATALIQEDNRASSARKIIAPHYMFQKYEGHISASRVRDLAAFISPLPHHASSSVSWSLSLVNLSAAPSIFSLPPSKLNKITQHNLNRDTSKTRIPHPTVAPSRFACPNRFQLLSQSSHPRPC